MLAHIVEAVGVLGRVAVSGSLCYVPACSCDKPFAVSAAASRYWTLSQAQPTRFHPVQSPLPSDSRFRQDLKALAAGDAEAAQAAKEAMEHLQRRDRKLREEAGVHEGHGH